MLYVNADGTIRLTRGDTAQLEITIKNGLTEEVYDMAPNDILSFTIKKSVKDETALVHKESKGTNTFHIEPKDTAELSFRKYFYDVQLARANGDVYTVIVPTTFEIMKEVTY